MTGHRADKLLKPERGIPLIVPDLVAELRFPDIRDLAERLRFSPTEGRIWLDDRRMVLIHTLAFGTLRQELIEALGVKAARGLLTRMGYIAGSKDAELARKVRPNGSLFDCFCVGPQLHALEGVVLVEPVRLEIDSASGHYYGEYLWKDSSEDDSHIAAYGVGAEPACWMQLGYANGYASAFMGKRILHREMECRAMGNDRCLIIGRPVEEWEDAEEDMALLDKQHFDQRAVVYLNGNGLAPPALSPVSACVPAPRSRYPDIRQLVGVSPGFNTIMHKVRRVAPTQATVLLLGESGVGKSKFAHAIHFASPRAAAPFVEINCATIPEQLMEAELFGAERGSYTGATDARQGRFEVANGGTLFLDEVATLSLVSQGKMLRAIQAGEIERLGSSKTIKVNVRIVAATNVDLRKEVKQGRFREDLFYRLNVFPIVIPPLRERKDDIPVFLEHFMKRFITLHGRQLTGFTNRALQTMLNYSWPGNIRELENVLERGVILAQEGGPIDVCHLFTTGESVDGSGDSFRLSDLGSLTCEVAAEANGQDAMTAALSGPLNLEAWAMQLVQTPTVSLGDVENEMVRAAVKQTDGNLVKAAALLGITRAQLDYRVKKLADAKTAPPLHR
jgi:two-component system response regulator HydG